MKFYEYPSGMIVCGECFEKDLQATKRGELKGDEAVTRDMGILVPGTDYQCDSCLEQGEGYGEE